MKVYELIKELEKVPAMAEVRVNICMSIEEFIRHKYFDEDRNETVYEIYTDIEFVDGDNCVHDVVLHCEE